MLLKLELEDIPSRLKSKLADEFNIKHLLNEDEQLSENACHLLCYSVIEKVTEAIKNQCKPPPARGRKKVLKEPTEQEKELSKLLQDLNDHEDDYKFLLLTLVYDRIKNQHKTHILNNLPTSLDTDTLAPIIRPYSKRKRKGLDKDALISYLEATVFMYRSGLNQTILPRLIQYFSQDEKGMKWLKLHLRDQARKQQDQYWPTGKHEWMPCDLILDILRRSAGMEQNIKPYIIMRNKDKLTLVDWLSIHAEMRSPIRHLYFNNPNSTISSGHTPAIRDQLDGRTWYGTQTTGSSEFHDALRTAFYESTNPREFVRKVPHVSKQYVVSGKKHFKASKMSFFTVEGVSTKNVREINELRHDAIRPDYKKRKEDFAFFSDLTREGNDGCNIPSCSSEETSYSM